MTQNLEQRRIFLIASSNTIRTDQIASVIAEHVAHAVIYKSFDGADAISKMANAAPHVLVTDLDLPKFSGVRIVDAAISRRAAEKTAVVILSEIPNQEHFVDEVAIGQVQFLADPTNEIGLVKCIAKALNFVSAETDPEFKLKFLAPHDILIRMGEKAEAVYLVKRGTLRAFTMEGDKEVILGQIDTGDFVGEMAYINGEPRSAYVAASTDCELIEIPMEHLDNILFTKPAWSKALLKTLSKRVKISNQRVAG